MSSIRSPRVTRVPARLLIFLASPRSSRFTSWTVSTSSRARVVSAGGEDRMQPRDVAVVVGAEHVDEQVVTPARLVEVVGDVRRQVGASRRRRARGRGPSRRRRRRCGTRARRRPGRRRRRPPGRRPPPPRAPRHAGCARRRGCRSYPEAREIGADGAQHQLLAPGGEALDHLGVEGRGGVGQPVADLLPHGGGDPGDVVAVVPVLGDLDVAPAELRVAHGHRRAEGAHLAPVVVDVVLPRDGMPGEGQDPPDRVAVGRRRGRGPRGAGRWG